MVPTAARCIVDADMGDFGGRRRHSRWLVAGCCLLAITARAAEKRTFDGKVVGVADGDTITVLHNKEEHKIRLAGIDCPELKGQPFGAAAKKLTSKLVFGKMVKVTVTDTDRYGRLVAEVYLPDGKCLNQELVRSGMAWWYRRYAPDDEVLAKLEVDARKARRGLWAEKAPTPPWEWRASRR